MVRDVDSSDLRLGFKSGEEQRDSPPYTGLGLVSAAISESMGLPNGDILMLMVWLQSVLWIIQVTHITMSHCTAASRPSASTKTE